MKERSGGGRTRTVGWSGVNKVGGVVVIQEMKLERWTEIH